VRQQPTCVFGPRGYHERLSKRATEESSILRCMASTLSRLLAERHVDAERGTSVVQCQGQPMVSVRMPIGRVPPRAVNRRPIREGTGALSSVQHLVVIVV
jgi:hypothetical protein